MTTTTTTRVQLTLYATKLKNVAGTFKGTSDPYCVVTLLASDPRTERPTVLGQTEVIKNSLNPRWTKAFLIDYEFGKPTRINVGIYDQVRKAHKNKPMGSAMFEIGDILGARGNIKAKTLRGGGTLYAHVERCHDRNHNNNNTGAGTFYFSLRGIKLKNVDGLFKGKSDPFFEVSRKINSDASSSWQVVYRSKHVLNDLNPTWPSASISMDRLCHNNREAPILISVYDWEKSGKHTPMGSFETSVNGLLAAKGNLGDVKRIDTSKAFFLKRRGTGYGMIVVASAHVTGGGSDGRLSATTTATTRKPVLTQSAAPPTADAIPFSMALDAPPPSATRPATAGIAPAPADAIPFSMALDAPPPPTTTQELNDMPLGYNLPTPVMPLPPPAAAANRKPDFVDYISGGCELQMCVAIDFTGSNGDPRRPGTLHYIHRDGQLNDYEKALTAVGSIVARYDFDHKFPVWGFGAKYSGVIQHCFQVGRTAEANGIGAILEGYRGVFKSGLTMSGPTVFTEVIQLAAAQARSKQEESKRIGQQAYSILLILTDGAVSDINATKAAIEAASDAPLSIVIVGIGNADFSAMQFLDDFHTHQGRGRDICQFVEFSKHKDNKISLTQATLDEIPAQLVDYFYSRGIMPLPPIHGSRINLIPDAYNEDEDIDLTMDVNPDGEICLANNEGFYDDTGYGDISQYSNNVAVLPPPAGPAATAPPGPSVPHQPTATTQPAPYAPHVPQQQPSAPAYQVQHSYGQTPQHSYGRPSQQYSNSAAPATVVASAVFHVQLPPGVSSGMQIQVQHPKTRQNMIVTVPQGVPPGGTFPVAY